jgi:hypothetical protein
VDETIEAKMPIWEERDRPRECQSEVEENRWKAAAMKDKYRNGLPGLTNSENLIDLRK